MEGLAMATSVWKGYVVFGMVSVPVRLCAAARSQSISFNQLHKCDHSRIRQVIYCQAEDKPVPLAELVRGYEYEKDRYIVIDDEEIQRIAPRTSRVMEMLEFVKADEIDPIFLDTSYYLQPEAAGERAYTLLFECLRRADYVGLAQLTMHNREHIVLIRPGRNGLLLHTIYYPDEVRAMDEFRADTTKVNPKELELAHLLVENLAAPFEPAKYWDNFRESLHSLIETKRLGGQVVGRTPEAAMAPVIDIFSALTASLSKTKKPGLAETARTGKSTNHKPRRAAAG
jgi:DNA end-binding protein Ku